MANKTKYAKVCGLQFAGDTVAIAKANGEREVTKLAREANLGPSMYQVGEITVLVWPVLEGWGYTLFGGPTDSNAPNGAVRAMCNTGGTREQVVRSAVFHAAQWQWSHDVADDEAYYTDAFSCIVVKNDMRSADIKADIAEGLCHAQWQRRWKAAHAVCGDKNAAHDIATRTRTIDEARELAMRETVIAA